MVNIVILANLIVLENLLLLVKLVIRMMLVAGDSGNFVVYGDFDDSGESCEENLVSLFLDVRYFPIFLLSKWYIEFLPGKI